MPNNLDPAVAQRVNNAARQIIMTKKLIENEKNWDQRQLLQKQLDQAESEMQQAQIAVRATWGPG